MAGPFPRRHGRIFNKRLAARAKFLAALAILTVFFIGKALASTPCPVPKPDHTVESSTKPRAALVCLTSDSDINETVSTILEVETRFNAAYNYDWAVFSREELSTSTKDALSNATGGSAVMTFNLIPDAHWSLGAQAEVEHRENLGQPT